MSILRFSRSTIPCLKGSGVLTQSLRCASSLLTSNLDKEVFAALKANPLPGTVVSIVRPFEKEEVIHRCYGVANYCDENFSLSKPITPDTVFPVGSLTKNFTALGLMHLVEDGRVELDAPIREYLPFLGLREKKGSPITVRHLLTHTSGIREFRNYTDMLRVINPFGSYKSSSLREYYEGVPINPIKTPGEIYYKSHHNFGLAGCLIEELTNQKLRDYLKTTVFEPLGMKQTDLGLRDDMKPQLADAFQMGWKGYTVKRRATEAVAGASGGYASAADLSRYLRALLYPEKSGGVVSETMLDRMLAPGYRVNEHLAGQGLGFNVDRVEFAHAEQGAAVREDVGYLTCGQGMDWSGYQNAMVFSREMKVGAIMLANAGSYTYEASDIASRAFKLSIPHGWSMANVEPKQGPEVAVKEALGLTKSGTPSPQVWPRLTGFYQVPPAQLTSARLLWVLGGEVQVFQEKGKLFLRALWGPMRSNLTRRGPGVPLAAISKTSPYHFKVNSNKLALATPVKGDCNMTFDPDTGKLHIGLVTLEKRPFFLSMRLPVMGSLAYWIRWNIGKGKAFDITTSLFLI